MHEFSLNELHLLPVPALPCVLAVHVLPNASRRGGGKVFQAFTDVTCKWGKLRHGAVQ